MQSTGSPHSPWPSAAVVGGGDQAAETIAPGAASLDSSLIRQTKSEIRALASEIAQLADAPIAPEEFYAGFLLRVCTAMGATAAAVWFTQHQDLEGGPTPQKAAKDNSPDPGERPEDGHQPSVGNSYALVASHCLPSELTDAPEFKSQPELANCPGPGSAHRRILDCIVAEGQPILVPPGNVKILSERPQNPLGEALIVVPVRVESEIEFLLEVVHKPSGGPTANRGYLRFVAQMADLLSDYQRKHRLREVTEQRKQLHQLSGALQSIAAQETSARRLTEAADAACDLAEANNALILATFGRLRVVAINGTDTFDRRSSIVESAEWIGRRLTRTLNAIPLRHAEWRLCCDLPDRRIDPAGNSDNDNQAPPPAMQGCVVRLEGTVENGNLLSVSVEAETDTSDSTEYAGLGREINSLREEFERLGQELGCQRLLVHPLRSDQAFIGILGLGLGQASRPGLASELRAIGGLLLPAIHLRPSERFVAKLFGSKQQSSLAVGISTWLMRCALVGLLVALACFPVQDSVITNASLHPAVKQAYYAQENGVVDQVFVTDGQEVVTGEPLLQLRNPTLESQFDQLLGEQEIVRQKIDDRRQQLRRGASLELAELDQIESELKQLSLKKAALDEESNLVAARLAGLKIVARGPGRVSAWDSDNTLMHRPVGRGELLLGTFQPEEAWILRLAIPARRFGLLQKHDGEDQPSRIEFSLTSHPEQTFHAELIRTSQTAAWQDNAQDSDAIIFADAIVDSSTLPLKTDGAVARASLQCGSVPAVWLVVRDAYYAVSSRIKMLW